MPRRLSSERRDASVSRPRGRAHVGRAVQTLADVPVALVWPPIGIMSYNNEDDPRTPLTSTSQFIEAGMFPDRHIYILGLTAWRTTEQTTTTI